MRSTRTSPRELARSVSKEARDLAGKVRRFIVSRAGAAARWQILGHDLEAIGGEDVETHEAEVFAGVGFAARPSSSDDGGDVEAIVVFPGEGSGSPIIVGTRQEGVRRVVAADLEADETQIHGALNEGGAVVRIRRNRTVEIREVGGSPQRAILGETYRSAEDTLVTAMSTFSAAIATFAGFCTGPTAPQLAALEAAAVAFQAAVTTFQAGANSYLTSVLRAQ